MNELDWFDCSCLLAPARSCSCCLHSIYIPFRHFIHNSCRRCRPLLAFHQLSFILLSSFFNVRMVALRSINLPFSQLLSLGQPSLPFNPLSFQLIHSHSALTQRNAVGWINWITVTHSLRPLFLDSINSCSVALAFIQFISFHEI